MSSGQVQYQWDEQGGEGEWPLQIPAEASQDDDQGEQLLIINSGVWITIRWKVIL